MQKIQGLPIPPITNRNVRKRRSRASIKSLPKKNNAIQKKSSGLRTRGLPPRRKRKLALHLTPRRSLATSTPNPKALPEKMTGTGKRKVAYDPYDPGEEDGDALSLSANFLTRDFIFSPSP